MRIQSYQGNQISQKLSETAKDKAKVLEQMATGKKLNSAADDAANIAVAREFEKQIRAYRSASENIQAGISALSISDGSASNISDMLQRQQDLATQASNGTLTDDQRSSLNNEYQSISQEIDRESKASDYNGQSLLDGQSKLSDGTGQIQSGSDQGDTITLNSSDLSLSALGTGSSSITTSDGALSALSAIDAAMKKVNDNRANNGALSDRLDAAMSSNDSAMINTTQGLSNIEDLDYAQATTDKVKDDILSNSQTAALSQFNQLSRTHLLALLQ